MDQKKGDCSDNYIIKMSGPNAENLEYYIEGFSMENRGTQVVLTGSVIDNSALIGLIERLLLLGLKLDSLERI